MSTCPITRVLSLPSELGTPAPRSHSTRGGHSKQTNPLLNALRLYVSLKEPAMTHGTPKNLSAVAACSREEPVPKFIPLTMTSPGLAHVRSVGS
jgi:hypothetical protein